MSLSDVVGARLKVKCGKRFGKVLQLNRLFQFDALAPAIFKVFSQSHPLIYLLCCDFCYGPFALQILCHLETF